FLIDLEEALTYPSIEKICEYIEGYGKDTKQDIEFVSKEKPVTFYIEKELYEVKVDMARGGYTLHCTQV
ncbi:MAG: DUF4318 domain-containing protein, partial [Niameybacter sp.]